MTAELFNQNFKDVKGCMYDLAFLLTANAEKAQSLVSDTAVVAVERRNEKDDSRSFKRWVLSLMRNVYVDKYVAEKADELPSDQTADEVGSIEGAYDIMNLPSFLLTLPRIYRIPFCMHATGFSIKQIAARLNLPFNRVLAMLNKSCASLKNF